MNKKKFKLFFILISIIFIIFAVISTFSKFISTATGNGKVQVAKWHVKVGEIDISSEGEHDISTEIHMVPEANAGVAEGKIAPRSTFTGSFTIDPCDTEVNLEYTFSIGNIEYTGTTTPPDIQVQKVTVDGTEVRLTSEKSYRGVIEINSSENVGKPVEVIITGIWLPKERDNTTGIELGEILLPINVRVGQCFEKQTNGSDKLILDVCENTVLKNYIISGNSYQVSDKSIESVGEKIINLVENGNFVDSSKWYLGERYLIDSDIGCVKYKTKNASNVFFKFYQQLQTKANHKYYIGCLMEENVPRTQLVDFRMFLANDLSNYPFPDFNIKGSTGNNISTILSPSNDNAYIGISIQESKDVDEGIVEFCFRNFLCVDLTEMFGEGNEPTVEMIHIPYEADDKYIILVTVKNEKNIFGKAILLDEPLRKVGDIADELNFGTKSVQRRIGKIESYNGEEITTDYISSTGGLDTGATILYVLENPIEEKIDLPGIDLYQGNNIITVNTKTTPSQFTIEY